MVVRELDRSVYLRHLGRHPTMIPCFNLKDKSVREYWADTSTVSFGWRYFTRVVATIQGVFFWALEELTRCGHRVSIGQATRSLIPSAWFRSNPCLNSGALPDVVDRGVYQTQQ